jgi:hypothetical protein
MGFMCMSDQTMPDTGELKCHFLKRLPWTRGVVRDAPVLQSNDTVNPLLKVSRGKPGRDFDRSARRKQWLAGWKTAHAMKSMLWKNMAIDTTSMVSHVMLHGCDTSMAEAVMRSSSMTPFKGPREQVVMSVWATIDTDTENYRAKISDWIKDSTHRVLTNFLKEQLYVVPGWSSDQHRSSVQRPAYQEDEFKATFPTPANTLPIRAEWLDMMRQKITNTDLRKQFEAMVKEHDATHNPTGQPYRPDTGLPRAAEGLPAQSEPLPEVEGEPKSKDELIASGGPYEVH